MSNICGIRNAIIPGRASVIRQNAYRLYTFVVSGSYVGTPRRAGPSYDSGFRFRACEEITLNAEAAETAEKNPNKNPLRAQRALRSNVAFFSHSLAGP